MRSEETGDSAVVQAEEQQGQRPRGRQELGVDPGPHLKAGQREFSTHIKPEASAWSTPSPGGPAFRFCVTGSTTHPTSGAANPCIVVSAPVTSPPPNISSPAPSPASSHFSSKLQACRAGLFLQHLPQASLPQTPLWATTLCQTLHPPPVSALLLLLCAISPLITYCLVFFAAWPSLRVDPQTGQFSS